MWKKLVWGGLALALIAALGYGGYQAWWHANYYSVTRTDYNAPQDADELRFEDDLLESKQPNFDPQVIDSRPLGDWVVNASAAVVRLDCPMLLPDRDAELLKLRASYADAVKAAKARGTLLPSTNLLDGSAKQFDDGLYAALDLAAFRGELGLAPPAPRLIQIMFEKLPAESPARPFLVAALRLWRHTIDLPADQESRVQSWVSRFKADEARSKPISFYTWTPELKEVWRFYRFLQHEFDERDLAIPRDIAAVLEKDEKLRQQYAAVNGLYERLTNPLSCLSIEDLIGASEPLAALAKKRGTHSATVAVFPPSTSRETELFNRAFPLGLPPGANLMARLIHAIRSGQVELKPGEKDGWYQYQVYALETLLLPTRGQEEPKLLLTASYKKRLVEAFKALVTKRRETHARQLATAKDAMARPLGKEEMRPRLRVEPCATYYLRTARAYAFLQNFLLSAVGNERMAKLHGLRQSGPREPNLADELESMRQRFYGLYLVSCEDLGMAPKLLADEPVDQAAAKGAALKWLANLESDVDMACDTRVSVPIFIDTTNNTTRIWATLGVRLAKLDTAYARAPKIRPKDDPKAQWKDVESYQTGSSDYLIPVDEFAEISLSGSASLTREELRAACDQHETKEEIVSALSK
jgi:hypothetical protein